MGEKKDKMEDKTDNAERKDTGKYSKKRILGFMDRRHLEIDWKWEEKKDDLRNSRGRN